MIYFVIDARDTRYQSSNLPTNMVIVIKFSVREHKIPHCQARQWMMPSFLGSLVVCVSICPPTKKENHVIYPDLKCYCTILMESH